MKKLNLKSIVVFGLGLGLDLCAQQRPNVLMVFADDLGKYGSCYRQGDDGHGLNEVITTPHFDRVAKEGVTFQQAHVSAPSCTPCRSALLSGQHFWRTGRASILSTAQWEPSLPAFPLMLKESGYHIGKSLKVWSPGSPADAPFGEQAFAYNKYDIHKTHRFSTFVTGRMAAGVSLAEATAEVDEVLKKNLNDFLKANQEGKPFFFWYGPMNTHRMWEKGSGKKLWGIDPDGLKGKLPSFLPDVPEVREDVADYLGEVLAVDHALGVLLEELEKRGLMKNTMVVVSGDHGMPGVTHGKCNLYDHGTEVPLLVSGAGIKGGRSVQDLVSIVDLAPTFLDYAGVKIPESMTGKSLRGVLESEKSGQVQSSPQVVYFGRERHAAKARAGFLPYPQRGIRTHDYLLIVNFKPERNPMGDPNHQGQPLDVERLEKDTFYTFGDFDMSPTKAWLMVHEHDPEWEKYFDYAFGKRPEVELYDLKKDPNQVVNVAGELAYAGVVKELKDRLMAELKNTGDPRVVQDPVPYEHAPYTDIEANRKMKSGH